MILGNLMGFWFVSLQCSGLCEIFQQCIFSLAQYIPHYSHDIDNLLNVIRSLSLACDMMYIITPVFLCFILVCCFKQRIRAARISTFISISITALMQYAKKLVLTKGKWYEHSSYERFNKSYNIALPREARFIKLMKDNRFSYDVFSRNKTVAIRSIPLYYCKCQCRNRGNNTVSAVYRGIHGVYTVYQKRLQLFLNISVTTQPILIIFDT